MEPNEGKIIVAHIMGKWNGRRGRICCYELL